MLDYLFIKFKGKRDKCGEIIYNLLLLVEKYWREELIKMIIGNVFYFFKIENGVINRNGVKMKDVGLWISLFLLDGLYCDNDGLYSDIFWFRVLGKIK